MPLFEVDRTSHEITEIRPSTFPELRLWERQDLEAWVTSSPDLAGGDFTVVTSEFDRFDRTSERLDVLGLVRTAMKEGPPRWDAQRVTGERGRGGPMLMLHAGLDLSRRRLDVCLIGDHGDVVGRLAAPPDADGLRRLVERVGPQGRVRGVIESMTGARFVRDTLEELGWEVLIADAQKVKGLAPLACKTDRIDAQVLAVLSHRDLVPAIWLPDPRVRAERDRRAFGCIWSSTARCSSTASTRR
jgi:hypothetical protein